MCRRNSRKYSLGKGEQALEHGVLVYSKYLDNQVFI